MFWKCRVFQRKNFLNSHQETDESKLSCESSDERTGSTTAAFVPYDENLEPIATENEAAEYAEEVG